MTTYTITDISFGPGWYCTEKHNNEFKWGSKEFYILIDSTKYSNLTLTFKNPHKTKKFRVYGNNSLILEDHVSTNQSIKIELDIKTYSVIKIESDCYTPPNNQRMLSLMLTSVDLDHKNLPIGKINLRSLNFADIYHIPPISYFIDQNQLSYPINNLESIGLLTTDYEINKGVVSKFIDTILNSNISTKLTKKITFNIFSNQNINSNYKTTLIKKTNRIFQKTNFISFDLDPYEDIYFREDISRFQGVMPKYGLLSGPNLVFFKAIEYSIKYNTTLFLETDCILQPYWLDKIYEFVKQANGFLISGATYDGDIHAVEQNKELLTHINGGIALYHTKHTVLQQLYQYLQIFLAHYVVRDNPKTAYDYALKILLDNNLYDYNISDRDHQIWKFINRYYLKNNLIGNYSTENSIAKLEDINRLYNFYIIHKK